MQSCCQGPSRPVELISAATVNHFHEVGRWRREIGPSVAASTTINLNDTVLRPSQTATSRTVDEAANSKRKHIALPNANRVSPRNSDKRREYCAAHKNDIDDTPNLASSPATTDNTTIASSRLDKLNCQGRFMQQFAIT